MTTMMTTILITLEHLLEPGATAARHEYEALMLQLSNARMLQLNKANGDIHIEYHNYIHLHVQDANNGNHRSETPPAFAKPSLLVLSSLSNAFACS